MTNKNYNRLSAEQKEKLGNSIVYLSNRIPYLSKTKLLKLIYILDEQSIKKSGIPFFNFEYKTWKLGPVAEEIFVDLSSETFLLKDFVEKTTYEDNIFIISKADFNDDEFSENDIELMEFVVKRFGGLSANELVEYTHKPNSPWYITAKKMNVLDLLLKQEINSTDFLVDMKSLIDHDDRKKSIYSDYLDFH